MVVAKLSTALEVTCVHLNITLKLPGCLYAATCMCARTHTHSAVNLYAGMYMFASVCMCTLMRMCMIILTLVWYIF